MKKLLFILITSITLIILFPSHASAVPALGIHLLDPNELEQALDLVSGTQDQPGAVTVVLRSDDHSLSKWQKFFDLAAQNNVTPLIRLATAPVTISWPQPHSTWRRPVKKDIVSHADFLNFLNWHRDRLAVIAFNEPNHAGEWGGEVDPESYVEILDFTLNWFHTEPKQYTVLPAGLDAAAPNGPTTMDSFTFLKQILAAQPALVDKIDGWVSHSYPNPGFVGSPTDTSKMSLRGFTHELALLKQYTNRNLDVYITETGWIRTPKTEKFLPEYYSYAIDNIWNSEQIKAITPFVFSALSGPFQEFSFISPAGTPTLPYLTLKKFKPQPPSQFSLLTVKP